MKETEIIYPLDKLDIIPVKAEDVVCFWKELEIHGGYRWIAVELKDGTFLLSNRYEYSDANNLMRTLLKNNDFVLMKPYSFSDQGDLTTLYGVRFSAITKIGEYMDYVEYGHYSIKAKLVESTVKNYKKWIEAQKTVNECLS